MPADERRRTDPPDDHRRRPGAIRGALTRAPGGAPAWAAVASAGAGFVACLVGRIAGGGAIDVAWAPTLGLRLDLAFDGLAALYALLATGIGAAVFAYGAAYLPRHLAHEGRPAREGRRFWFWMVVFMGAMVGLACARDLVLLFVLFDVTAIASYFLIGFDRGRREARGAALMAMLVTGVSAVALLIGAVLLQAEYGTFSVTELAARAQPDTRTSVAAALIAVAALAKSAQVPLHFWLPRAMEAPTPVSAYLHSAAMVAAGVLVIGRVHPLLALDGRVLRGLLVVGLASIVVGGVLSLAQDELKQVLAASTISQYGYVVALYGMGGAEAAGAAALYVVAHALGKSALFMTAGAVTEATGETRLSRVGGLWRDMPVLAAASGLAVATLAALPLTVGFFKDELFFGAATASGPAVATMAVVAAALTVAYAGRFWIGIFLGPRRARARPLSGLLVGPIAALAVVCVAGGVVVEPFSRLARGAAVVTHGGPVALDPAYHLTASAENLMALGAWAAGALILAAGGARDRVAGAVARAGRAVGPRRLYGGALVALNRWSDALHATEVRDLRNSIAAVLLPTGVLIAIAFALTPTGSVYVVGPLGGQDLVIVVLLALSVVAAVVMARDDGRVRPVLSLSVLGFALAAAYAVLGAPDVALVAVVVESVVTLAFIGIYSRLPADEGATRGAGRRPPRRWRNAIAGVAAGAAAFVTIWAALSRTSASTGDSARQIARAPSAHGGDVVTVTLADFRGLDTMVEITVLAVAVVGVASLLRRGGRPW